ncbi:uncharacterized protein LOC116347472 [Contarinia nasturtii]|uniref:uncharacterized protein LOC116347472 n=1 Tax=Contarinia nasturtii TaxID=265458 RepID=UPI0012D493CF|nr:uncharacterized protein LOC116347472 [Contarinia nasturtii]
MLWMAAALSNTLVKSDFKINGISYDENYKDLFIRKVEEVIVRAYNQHQSAVLFEDAYCFIEKFPPNDVLSVLDNTFGDEFMTALYFKAIDSGNPVKVEQLQNSTAINTTTTKIRTPNEPDTMSSQSKAISAIYSPNETTAIDMCLENDTNNANK